MLFLLVGSPVVDGGPVVIPPPTPSTASVVARARRHVYTLSGLREQVLSWLDEAGDTGSTKTNVDNALNFVHQQRCNTDRWTFMQGPALTFPLVLGKTEYALDASFGRPLYFLNRATQSFLNEVPTRELESFSTYTSAVTGEEFAFAGISPVSHQPSAASTITLTSSDVLDTGEACAVTITGVTEDGVIGTETIVPAGTAGAAGALEFTSITAITLDATWSGDMTISATVDDAVLEEIPAGEFPSQRPIIRLLWLPASADTIEYRFFVQPRELVNDTDVPNIPYPHSNVLVWDALLLLAAYDNQTEPGRIALWTRYRDQAELQMRQTYLEGQAVGARVRYVRSINDGQSYL